MPWVPLRLKRVSSITGKTTTVRVRNVNTNTFVNSTVQTPDGHVDYDGDTEIASVPGHAAPVALTFLNACGTKQENCFLLVMLLIPLKALMSVVLIWQCL